MTVAVQQIGSEELQIMATRNLENNDKVSDGDGTEQGREFPTTQSLADSSDSITRAHSVFGVPKPQSSHSADRRRPISESLGLVFNLR